VANDGMFLSGFSRMTGRRSSFPTDSHRSCQRGSQQIHADDIVRFADDIIRIFTWQQLNRQCQKSESKLTVSQN
jgi:hypothetical protein